MQRQADRHGGGGTGVAGRVDSVAAIQHVIAVAALQRVDSVVAIQHVVAGAALQRVVTPRAAENIGARIAGEGVAAEGRAGQVLDAEESVDSRAERVLGGALSRG